MDDLLPEEMALKRRIEGVIRDVFRLYGYLEIETPTVEYYELFAAKSGEEIRERMFDFYDKAGRRLVLRPEVTASVARLLSTKLKVAPLPLRLGYIADCYRYDEPQWGRKRRFWQGGFELFGSRDPLADAEILQVSFEVFRRLGLTGQYFKVGHVGILRSLLSYYKVEEKTQDAILTMIDRKLVEEAFQLMAEKDVDEEGREAVRKLINLEGEDMSKIVSEASQILSPWDEPRKMLQELREIVELAVEGGVEAKIIVSPGFARGLEYYTGFIFEQSVPDIGISLNGGGRYDRLVELFGGRPTPGVGCAIGITRILQYMVSKENLKVKPKRPNTLLVGIPNVSKNYIMKVAQIIRENNIPLEVEVTGKRVPAAIDYALKAGMKYLVIVGEKEEREQKISIRNLLEKTQVEVSLKNVERIRSILGEGAE